MEKELLEAFINGGVYVRNDMPDCIFICTACSNSTVGKLTRYNKNSLTMYEKTNMSYFLNDYAADNIKAMFLNRENYDIIGYIGNNYNFSEDGQYLLKVIGDTDGK